MADVQTENGHTQIANELLEAIYTVPLSDYEHRVFMFILRKTYGFKKKQDWISQKQISKELSIYKSHISRTIKKLRNKNMIINSVIKNKKILGIQKDYEQWKLPKQVTKKLTQIGNKYRNLKEKLPKQVTKVTHTGNQKLPIQAHTKDTITKEYNIETKMLTINTYSVFNYWNSKKELITHREMNNKFKSKIKKLLKYYSLDEILTAIDNYAKILSDDKYWLNYRWTIGEFIDRGFEKLKDFSIAEKNYIVKDKQTRGENGKRYRKA